jgi:hypothetical protein
MIVAMSVVGMVQMAID